MKSEGGVLKNILSYLEKLGKKCILVAHNGNFDSERLIQAMINYKLFDEFRKFVHGFTDSIPLFQKNLKSENFKLTTLASKFLHISITNAHDAIFDVETLEKLSLKYLLADKVIESSKSPDEVYKALETRGIVKKIIKTYEPMKGVLKEGMLKRLCENNISYDNLVDAYKKSELQAIELLKGKVNGKPTIIKTKKILDAILGYLRKINNQSM